MNRITWAQAQQLLAPALCLEHIPESLYEQTGDPAALAMAVVLWDTQPRYTLDEIVDFNITKVLAGLDELLEALQQARRQLEDAIHLVVCDMPFCRWIGTTSEAGWNADDQEYRCPECGSSEISILTPEEAAEAISYVDEQAEKMRSALERIGVAEANHEHA